MKKLALSALAILLLLTVATAAPAGQKFRWSANSPEGYPDYEAAMWVKRYVEEHTGGEIVFEVYPANQLGDWLQVFDEIIMGTIDFCTTSVPDSYDPRIAACTLPYLTSNYNEIRSVFRPGGYYDTTLQGIYADLGVKYFGIYCDGYCGVGVQVPLTNAHEINKPKGALIRVPPVSAYQWTMERLGFRTSTIPYTDTFTSLQTGIVQGWIGGPVSQHYGQWTDVENHYYNYDVWQEARHYIGSLKTWQSLKPEHQQVIEEAIQIAAARSIDLAEQYDKEYLDKLSAKDGFTVVRITDAERAAMADDVHKNIWPGRLADQYGLEFLENLLKDMKENVATFEK